MLPLRPRSKFPPPDGTTGHTGVDPSYPDIHAWCEDFRDGNLALRMPDGVIGIDVDAYDGRNGALTLAEAEKRWGALPQTWHSSSRMPDDKASGIRFFRVPPGTYLVGDIKFPEMGSGTGNIEIIQRHHRYAVVFPSIHKDTEKTYFWFYADEHVIIPRPEDFPYLPDTWVAALRINYTSRGVNMAEGEAAELIAKCQTTGPMSGRVTTKLGEAMAALADPGGSRHDLVLKYVLTLMRYGKDGDGGVASALAVMEQQFVAVLSVSGERWAGNAEGARLEFRRMVDNDNAAVQLSAPSKDDWVRAAVVEAFEAQPAAAPAAPAVVPVVPAPAPASAPVVAAPVATKRTSRILTNSWQEQLESIENGFWDSRESLNLIYKAALSRMAPPWAVLGVVAARVLCTIPPKVVLPPIIGGVGSLNSFFALTAPSGGGKGSSVAVGKELVRDFIIERKLGSGEGFIKILEGNKSDPASRPEAVWFDAAEIDGLKAMGDRTGSTLLEKLRDAWSGASLGFGYKDDSFIDAHSYRMGLTLGVQPARAGWLLADEGGGTPQRFLFLPAFDARCSRANHDMTYMIPALNYSKGSAWQYRKMLTVPQVVVDEIADAHELKMQGLTDGLDSHALFAREKFAVILSALEGGTDPSADDWELSGTVSKVSVWTRAMVTDGLKDAQDEAAQERGKLRGIENWSADLEKDQRVVDQVSRVTRWAVAEIRSAGPEGIAQVDLVAKAAGRDRRCLSGLVLNKLVQEGFLRCAEVDGLVRWWIGE